MTVTSSTTFTRTTPPPQSFVSLLVFVIAVSNLLLLFENAVESFVTTSPASLRAVKRIHQSRTTKSLTSLSANDRRGPVGRKRDGDLGPNRDDDDENTADGSDVKKGRRVYINSRSSVPSVRNGVRQKRTKKGTSTLPIDTDVKDSNNSIKNKKRNSKRKQINDDLLIEVNAKTQKATSPYTDTFNLALSHELLTKSDEQRLGKQLQRAIQLKQKVEDLVDARNLRRIEIERNDEETIHGGWDDGFGLDDDDDDDDGYDDEYNEFSLSSILEERMWDGDYDLAGVAGRISEEDLANLSIVQGSDPSRNLEAYELNSLSNIDPLLYERTDVVGSFFATDQLKSLTDHEIINELGIEGGRSELYQIFIDGAEARDKFVRGNVKLVMSIAKSWFRRSAGSSKVSTSMKQVYAGSDRTPSLDEVVQEGIVGLAAAADRFEPGRDLKFSTYATYYITNEVRQCFQRASTGALRIPWNYYTIRAKYNSLIKAHYQTTGKRMSVEKILDEMGLTAERLSYVLSRTQPLVSLDGPAVEGYFSTSGKSGEGEPSDTWADILESPDPSPEELLERAILRQCLENAFSSELAPHERDVIRLKHGLDDGVERSARDVSELLGGTITEWQVRNTERNAFLKLQGRKGQSIHTKRLLSFDDLAGFRVDENATPSGIVDDYLL